MKIQDLQKGMMFVEWRLGYGVNNCPHLPEDIRPFFRTRIIEKVNKITFVEGGSKFAEVPSDWHIFTEEEMRRVIMNKAVRYFTNYSYNDELYCKSYTVLYQKFLSTCSDEQKDNFRERVLVAAKNHMEQKTKKFREKAADQIELWLGNREKRWNE